MKHLFLSLALFSPLLFHAQTNKFSFKMGDEYDLPRKTEDLAFVGNTEDGIVNLSLKKDELTFLRFDPQSLRKTSERPVDLSVTKNFDSEEVVDMQGKYYWIHSDWDKGAEKELLFYDKLDVKTGKIVDANHKLLENTKLAGEYAAMTGFYSYKVTGKYKFRYDANKKLLLVCYRFNPIEKKDKKSFDRIGLQVFDENMNKVWGNEYTMPYTEAVMDNSDFSIDGNGNAYLLAKVYNNDKRKEVDKETGKPGYQYELMQFTKNSKDIIRIPVRIDDYFVNEPSLIESPTHDMVVAFSYSKRFVYGGTDGIFLARIENGKLTKFRDGYYEFPVAEMEKYESRRTVKKMEKADDYEGTNIYIRNVLVDPDGGIFIALEDYRVVARTYTSSSGYTSTTYTYLYNNMYATKISGSSGKMEWFKKMPKKQTGSAGRGGMGFKLITDAAGYYFLYLDNLKNIDLETDEVPATHVDGKGGQLVVAKLDKAGAVTKEILFDVKDEDVKVFPTQFDKFNKNQFIGRAQLKKTLFKPLLITVN